MHLPFETVITSVGVGRAVVTTCKDTMKKLIHNVALRVVGIVFGMMIGAFLGAGTGIIGSFGGKQGLLVFAFIGGVVGFFAVPDAVRLVEKIGRLLKKVGEK